MRSPALRRLAFVATLVVAGGLTAACASTTSPSPSRPTDASAVPVASPGASSGLAAFETRLREATAREGELVRTTAAAAAGTPDDLRLAVLRIRQWVKDERDWLADHPADACFEAAATAYETAVTSMEAAAGGFSGVADASLAPSDDVSIPSAGTAAANALEAAARALADAADQAKSARTTCR